MARLVLGLLCLALAAPALAGRRCGDDVDGRVVPCDCGDVLVGSRTLADDPIATRVCPGTGLVVDLPPGQSATLALAGRNLAGSGSGYGIQVFRGGDGLVITGPGAVEGFLVGVFATRGGVTRIADVTAAQNVADGFSVVGDRYSISGCEALRNGRDGFALGGRNYEARSNRALENGRHGFTVAGRAASLGGVAGNESAGNVADGFRVRGRAHEITNATATANGRHGVVARGEAVHVTGAVTNANRGRGVRAVGLGAVVSGGFAHGNGAREVEVRGAHAGASDACEGGPCR